MTRPDRAPLTGAMLLIALVGIVVLASPSRAGVKDLPGIQDAAGMKEWLKLTDDQSSKLAPVIDTRIAKVDSALAAYDTAKDPDPLEFVKQYGEISREFDAGVARILTPDQLAQWNQFKVELEKDLSVAGARKQLKGMQPALHLTDEQVVKLEPAMITAVQKKIDLLQKLGASGRIGARDKLKAKRAMDDLNSDLEKSMATVMSPDQLAGYKTMQDEKKKK